MSHYLTKSRDIPSPIQSFEQLNSDILLLPGDVSLQDTYGDYNINSNKSIIKRFQENVSNLLNKEDGLFVISGIMSQLIALSIHTTTSQNNTPNNTSNNTSNNGNKLILCHYSSHLLIAENNSYKELINLNAIIIPPLENSLIQYPLTAVDVIKYSSESSILPSVIIVECPHRELGGKITPWEDLVQISANDLL